MDSQTRLDVIGGLLAITLGGILQTVLIPRYVDEDLDLRLPVSAMPSLVSLLLIFFGSLMIVSGLVKLRQPSAKRKFAFDGDVGMSMVVFAILACGVAALHVLPYLVVTPIMVLALGCLFGRLSFYRVLLIGAGAPVTLYFLAWFGLERVLP